MTKQKSASAPDRIKRDRYRVQGKDPNYSYKFVGDRHVGLYRSDGWVEVLKDENPDIKVPADKNHNSKTGVFHNGCGVLMMLPLEDADYLKARVLEDNESQMAKIKPDFKEIQKTVTNVG